jgi:NADP-dependent 3-hydroxy acid dehydrogenase YdfG
MANQVVVVTGASAGTSVAAIWADKIAAGLLDPQSRRDS